MKILESRRVSSNSYPLSPNPHSAIKRSLTRVSKFSWCYREFIPKIMFADLGFFLQFSRTTSFFSIFSIPDDRIFSGFYFHSKKFQDFFLLRKIISGSFSLRKKSLRFCLSLAARFSLGVLSYDLLETQLTHLASHATKIPVPCISRVFLNPLLPT